MSTLSEGIKICAHMKATGQQCQARAMGNSDFCFFHDPSKAQERAAARKAGGIARARHAVVLPPDTPNFELTSLQQVDRFLADMISRLARGELDPRIAWTIGYLLSIQLKLKQIQLGAIFPLS